MRYSCVSRLRYISIVAVFIVFCVTGPFVWALDLTGLSWGGMDASRILFLGNSITSHGAQPDIGWYGDWGMAASSQDKDYVHVLTSSVAQLAGYQPSIMAVTGMDAIAYELLAPMAAHPMPEPGALAMLITSLVGVFLYAVAKTKCSISRINE